MAGLVWGETGDRWYESGVDRGLLSFGIQNTEPVYPWNGLISVEEEEVDDQVLESHFDGVKYACLNFGGFYRAKIKAFAYPNEMNAAFGRDEVAAGFSLTGQVRREFNFSYRTKVNEDHHRVHVVYNATASLKGRTSKTMDKSTDPDTYEWTVEAVPPTGNVGMGTLRPSAHVVMDSRTAPGGLFAAASSYLYGTHGIPGVGPFIPSQQDFLNTF